MPDVSSDNSACKTRQLNQGWVRNTPVWTTTCKFQWSVMNMKSMSHQTVLQYIKHLNQVQWCHERNLNTTQRFSQFKFAKRASNDARLLVSVVVVMWIVLGCGYDVSEGVRLECDGVFGVFGVWMVSEWSIFVKWWSNYFCCLYVLNFCKMLLHWIYSTKTKIEPTHSTPIHNLTIQTTNLTKLCTYIKRPLRPFTWSQKVHNSLVVLWAFNL